MSKFIEVDGWEYSDDDKITKHYLLNLNHIVSAGVYDSEYCEDVEYTLSTGLTFYVSEETHQRILDELRENDDIDEWDDD